MPENNHEVIIDDYAFPDTVTVTLANDECVDSRDYVGKELYESVSEANGVWQAENAKLRELVRSAMGQVSKLCDANIDRCAGCPLHFESDWCRHVMLENELRDLGIDT